MPTDFSTAVKQEAEYLKLVHPTPEDIPGCMTQFDNFLRCHVMASQFRSLYRYGQTAVCTQKLDDFKFCMSVNSLHPEEKRELWIQRRAEWWANRRLTKSSEDVWEMRTVPLQNYPPEHQDGIQISLVT